MRPPANRRKNVQEMLFQHTLRSHRFNEAACEQAEELTEAPSMIGGMASFNEAACEQAEEPADVRTAAGQRARFNEAACEQAEERMRVAVVAAAAAVWLQ